MSNSTKTETTYKCDRCPEKLVLPNKAIMNRKWSRLEHSFLGQKAIFADLCPQCGASLIEWFKRGKTNG